KAKALIPGKPIRYVVAMHHHWDHLGGIRTAINEGAIIVSHRTNQALLDRIAKASHTIKPDRLSISKKPLKLQTVGADAMSQGEFLLHPFRNKKRILAAIINSPGTR